jgi:aminopeptidase
VHFSNADDIPPVVLVGKGITFDAGGISIKPADKMSLMKADMSGAAVVVSTVCAIAQLAKLNQGKVNVIAIAPLTENTPSGTATKPGDVHLSRSTKTVEVDNTDAEGRLVLADALDYAQTEHRPKAIVDVATLTGAIDTALGWVTTGAFALSDSIWEHLDAASRVSGEKMWRMPLYEEYRKVLQSRVADINNLASTRSAGACTAALFLREFIRPEFCDWLHLDIAGVMTNDTAPSAIASKGMSGKPVRTLVELVKNIQHQTPVR